MTTGMMRKTAVYAGLLAMTVGMASVQAPEGRAQGGVDRQMVYVPAGNISQVPLGSSGLLTKVAPLNYLLGKTEVTGALWKEVYDWAVTKGYTFVNQGSNLSTMLPVTKVSWYDVVIWTNAYSEKAGLVPVYRDTGGKVLKDARVKEVLDSMVPSNHNGYQLPTYEQSEMAARWLGTTAPTTGSLAKERIAVKGPDEKTYYWTPKNYASGAIENVNNALSTQKVAWYHTNSQNKLREVMGKMQNILGMHDVSGNVREWNFTKTNIKRMIWGGSWKSLSSLMAVSYVSSDAPEKFYDDVGFRLARRAQ